MYFMMPPEFEKRFMNISHREIVCVSFNYKTVRRKINQNSCPILKRGTKRCF
ncbi:hypothetical protein HMPREF7215_0359 [Pyramidobacter piscolens W5455]|uniref:Uncharacterized protein n=1 Tax=Pyramidobacter piscolens W5455 TaxID=352165 RepID=A0ABP2HVF4_9BACT|nr:hypothetical protein HMPREF7215_0359 [Pyramidobacter piscolens W5455]